MDFNIQGLSLQKQVESMSDKVRSLVFKLSVQRGSLLLKDGWCFLQARLPIDLSCHVQMWEQLFKCND